jgi:hypothetical protein
MKNVLVKSCSGEQERISGHVALRFSFEVDNGHKVSFIHDVLITNFIQQPLLLGRDFTGSSANMLETNSHLFLSDAEKNFENLNEMLNSPKVADVPIINHFTKKLPISNLQEALIPPQTLVSITCKLSQNDNPRFFLKQKKELVMAEVNTILHSDLKTPDTLLTFHDFQNIQIPLFNSSTEDILLPANFDLATLNILDKFTDIYQLNVTLDVHQSLEINSAQEIIQNDESLDDNEKEQAFMEYLQSGKYTKSMSQLITDSPSVTEMKLQKMEPWPLDEFEKQFDSQHLPQKSQKHALKVFKKKINIFCRHEMDIGCANDIEMDIEINNSKPRIQKYTPFH